MTTLREAAQQALEALEQCGLDDTHRSYEFEHAARAALRAALAQEEQEPVAWMNMVRNGYKVLTCVRTEGWEPLYTAPPSRREWQELTDEEITDIFEAQPRYHYPPICATDRWFARDIEAALRERNHE